jgi:hypothetical protein
MHLPGIEAARTFYGSGMEQFRIVMKGIAEVCIGYAIEALRPGEGVGVIVRAHVENFEVWRTRWSYVLRHGMASTQNDYRSSAY